MSSLDSHTEVVDAARGRQTLQERLAATKNRPAGFDYMRLCLACCVIIFHGSLITYGVNAPTDWVSRVSGSTVIFVVPMFFALSGFLVAGSLERSKSMFNFLGLRVFRIMPALSVEVLLSAFIFGPLLTNESLSSYFSSRDFHLYLLNVLGDIHYKLPGVFVDNPISLVNGQLWTVPYELVCYILLTVLTVAGVVRRRRALLAFMVLYYVAQIANSALREQTSFQGAGGSTVVMAFIAGLLVFLYRDRLIWSRLLFLCSLILALALPFFIPKGIRYTALPVAYLTVYLGLMNPSRNRLLLSGDYSYGLYLYGFPIQQAVYTAGPIFRTWYANVLMSLPLAAAVAAASWWVIERPALGRRGMLDTIERWFKRRSRVA